MLHSVALEPGRRLASSVLGSETGLVRRSGHHPCFHVGSPCAHPLTRIVSARAGLRIGGNPPPHAGNYGYPSLRPDPATTRMPPGAARTRSTVYP